MIFHQARLSLNQAHLSTVKKIMIMIVIDVPKCLDNRYSLIVGAV